MRVYLVRVSVGGWPFTCACTADNDVVDVLYSVRERLKLDIDMACAKRVLLDMSDGSRVPHKGDGYSIRVVELDDSELGVYFD